MRYGGFLLLVLVIFTVARFWLWIAAAAGAVALAMVLWKLAGWLDRRLNARDSKRGARAAELAAIARRADEQNRLFLAGDVRGIYGEYPPREDFSPQSTT